jgi:hypothetical protein
MNKIHLIVRDLGGGQPVINIHGTATHYAFSWDAPRSGHVRTYPVETEEDLKTFRRETADILNQKLMWPILIDVSGSECAVLAPVVPDGPAEGEPTYAELKGKFLELRQDLELAREKVQALEAFADPAVLDPVPGSESEENEENEAATESTPHEMTTSEAAAILGNQIPEPEDSEAGKVLAAAAKQTRKRKRK